MSESQVGSGTVNTVLGPVSSSKLGVVAVHEALLSVFPGAQYAFDVTIDRAEIFETLASKLNDYREQGGGTIVDATGMFHGRDLTLYEDLARATGVHIVASTGMGPEEMLGGYFLTPQTNPPTPWPADKFADMFSAEVTEGMVVPRLERRGMAGIVTTAAAMTGMTATEESLFRGAACTGMNTGVPVSIRYGSDAPHDLDIVLDEGLGADRVLVGGLDRRDAVDAGWPQQIAERGAFVAIDHVGMDNPAHVTDAERAALVAALIDAGHAGRIVLSSSAIGVAKGQPDYDLPYSYILSTFVPLLKSQGVAEAAIQTILVDNPQQLLTMR